MSDPRAVMAARNNVDWYTVMWDLHGLQYFRDAFGFRSADTPPPYHGWVTLAAVDAPVPNIVAPFAGTPGFSVKDAFGAHDLSGFSLVRLFEATWVWHAPDAISETVGWEQITTSAALRVWEKAWSDTSPTAQRQFPDPILDRTDVQVWGRKAATGYDGGFIANQSKDCIGLSNCFGLDARPAATALCAQFGQGKPMVGYERGDDLAEALASGWQATGPLTVWHHPLE